MDDGIRQAWISRGAGIASGLDRRLVLLALGAFVAAVDGTLVIGLLAEIGRGVDASTAAVGQAVTVFAIAYAAFSPLLIVATRRWPLERLFAGALALFVVANLATGLASSLALLLIARVVAGAAAGVLMPTAAALASAISTAQTRGRALAVVVGGASAAAVVGAPLGTLLGVYVAWRLAFFAAATLAAALAALLAATRWPKPRVESVAGPPSHRSRLSVTLTLSVTFLWACGSFAFFSYLTLVTAKTAASGDGGVVIYLLVFGVAGLLGALVAGRIVDTRGSTVALVAALALVATALAGLALLASARPDQRIGIPLTLACIAAYGLGTWGVTPAQQHRLISHRGRTRVLLSLNASALYAGVAAGAAIGGAVIAAQGGVTALCAIATGLELAALGTLVVATKLPNVPPASQH